MTDSERAEAICLFCEHQMPATPSICDVPDMDFEMYLQPFISVGEKVETGVTLVFENDRFETAEFRVNFCPMCGRDLGEDE